jgi:predicted nucleotide-binding protein
MNAEEMRSLLAQQGAEFEEKKIQNGTQFRCSEGEFFSVYNSGKVVPGGRQSALTEIVKSACSKPGQAVPRADGETHLPREVFIVYGHDTTARDELELMIRRMGLNPIVLANLPAAGETIIEKLEAYIGQHGKAAYACVLLTPDDEGYKVGEEPKKKYRARQNVVLELGMVLARLGRKRVAILRKKTVEQPSDIDGLIYIPFDERVEEIKLKLIQELQAAGFMAKV